MALNSNFRTLTADNIEGIVDDRNYLKSSFENGTITGWTEVSVALTSGLPTGTPTIGATAASSLALSATSVTPLSGSRSLLVDVPSALTAGHGFISDEFTLDRMDLGKVLTVSFDYERVTGTYNFSGTLGSQTWMVYIYDATLGGANWIQPAGFLGMNQSSGPGRIRATFQSSVTAGQKYRVAVIASQAASGASSIEFDNFTCSRQTAPIGPVVTDWVSYSPTVTNLNAGTAPSQFYRWRRIGDSIQILGNITAGGTGIGVSGDVSISLPSGLSFDTSKLAIISETVVGTGSLHDSGIGRFPCSVNVNSSNSFCLIVRANAATGGNIVSNNFPSASWYNSAGDAISFELMAPISGWSSNVQLSNDTDTRVVAARMSRTTSQAVTGTSPVKVLLSTSSIDTHGAFDAANSRYIIPVTGYYRIVGSAYANPVTSGLTFQVYVRKNNNGVISAFSTSASSSDVMSVCDDVVQCNAGDIIELYVSSQDSSYNIMAPDILFLSVERISGPSVVAASETVAMRAIKNSGAQTSNANLQNIASFNSIVQDTHGIFNLSTGVATVPISGTYLCTFQVSFVANSNGARVARLLRNGNMEAEGNIYLSWADRPVMIGTALLKCNAGDILNLQAYQTSGGNLNYDTTLNNSTNFNIVRVGN